MIRYYGYLTELYMLCMSLIASIQNNNTDSWQVKQNIIVLFSYRHIRNTLNRTQNKHYKITALLIVM